MRKLIALLVIALTALVGASTASASKINLYRFCASTSPATRTSSGTDTDQTVSNPVRLGFGWAAQKQIQVQQFLAAQYATTISITSSTDPLALNLYPWENSWTQGGGIYWGPITAIQGTNNAGNTVPLFSSNYIAPDFNLPDGQYYLSLDLGLATGVNDGENAASPKSWLVITDCSFQVTG